MRIQGSRRGWLRIGLVIGAVALVAAGILVLRSREPAVSPRWNVLLVTLDTARRDHLSTYGYRRPTTPNLDVLAAESLVFERCIATSNWTLPSHASILTGVLPPTHGAHYVPRDQPHVEHVEPAAKMVDDLPTLAELLAAAGYRTGAVLANWWWLGIQYGLDRGFEHYDHRSGEPPIGYRRAEQITEEALRWLSQRGDQPFFLWLNYLDPHIPYAPPPPYDSMYGDYPEIAQANTWDFFLRAQRIVLEGRESLSPEVYAFLIDRYDGEITYLDAQLGRLFDGLREQGLYEDTVVIVTSDHGEAFGEHAIAGHGVALYEPEVAVPLILRVPGTATSRRPDHRVQQIDILPTVLELLGMRAPGGLAGRPLARRGDRDLVAVEYPRTTTTRARHATERMQWALYRDDLKLIEYSTGQIELYDLKTDPKELHDRSRLDPIRATELQAALAELRRDVPEAGPRHGESPELDEKTLQELRALGYVR